METRVLKSSFSGIKGAKKKRKMLEKSSTSYLGPGCREFESRHSGQKSRIRFCGVWTFLFVWSETRKIKCDCPVDSRLPTVRAAATPLFSSLREENANESRHSGRNRQFSARKPAGLTYESIKIFYTKHLCFYRGVHTPVSVVPFYICRLRS